MYENDAIAKKNENKIKKDPKTVATFWVSILSIKELHFFSFPFFGDLLSLFALLEELFLF